MTVEDVCWNVVEEKCGGVVGIGWWLLMGWMAVEVLFFVYCQYLISKWNGEIHSIPYRDYPKEEDRKYLLQSLLDRIQRSHNVTQFLQSWLVHTEGTAMSSTSHLSDACECLLDCMGDSQGMKVVFFSLPSIPDKTNTLTTSSSSSGMVMTTTSSMISNSSSSSSFCSEESDGFVNARDFICWALFHIQYHDLPSNHQELVLNMMHEQIGPLLKMPHDWNALDQYVPSQCMSFEPLSVLHRPLLFYLSLQVMRSTACYIGLPFQKHTTSRFTYWYRPSNHTNKTLIFFHGIAPGGLTLYIPFLRNTLLQLKEDYNLLLVENNAIASCIPGTQGDFTEPNVVQDVMDALRRHLPSSETILLMGHSFGSCPMTWLVQSKHFRSLYKLDTLVLLDPVSILLSEPFVMKNFLYTFPTNAIQNYIIRSVASQELGIQYYLRRHFAWYNCELFLHSAKDIPHIIVGLAGQDQIVPSTQIQQELQHHPHIQLLYWETEVHGGCVIKPTIWSQIRQILSSLS